jgi:hypothetical protein
MYLEYYVYTGCTGYTWSLLTHYRTYSPWLLFQR